MSETTETAPQGGGAAPEPAATETETTAPVTEGAADTEAQSTDQATEEQPRPSRADRRFAALSARLAAESAARTRIEAEFAEFRRGAPRTDADGTPTPEDIPRIVEERVAAEVAKRAAEERAERFHEAGKTAYADWQSRCQSLMQMGADAQMAELLIELPDGAKVAGALADDPEELERIAGIKTERGRAIALGKYAAGIAAAPPPPRVSRAPAPIRPLGGSARVEPNEYQMNGDQLVQFYSRQAMEARRR